METTAKEGTEVSGVVEKYLANKHGDIDAMELRTDKENVKISFPPHTAKTVMHNAEKGSHTTVTYQPDEPKNGGKADKKPKLKLETVNGAQGDVNIKETKPTKPSSEPHVETIELSNYELMKDKKGELVGIKTDNKLFHIHKKDVSFSDKLKPQSALKITAIKRTDDGFVNQEHDQVYHIKAITIDSEEYHSAHQHLTAKK